MLFLNWKGGDGVSQFILFILDKDKAHIIFFFFYSFT